MTKNKVASQLIEISSTVEEMTYKFNQRLLFAYNRERQRQSAAGEKLINYTSVWTAAEASSGAATAWFTGANGMALATCIKVKDVLRCNPFWLFDESTTIDAPFSISDSSQGSLLPLANSGSYAFGAESHRNTEPGPEVRGRIPLISEVQAGMWTEAVDIYEPGYAERWLPFLKNNGDNTFALRVVGDSMTARYGKSYPEGSIIFVNPDQRNPSNGDRIVAKLSGSDQVTFKIFTEEAGRRWLRALNDSYPPIFEPFAVVGKVVGKWEDE